MLIGIFADAIASTWQLALATYNASFRSAAGISLQRIGNLTGCEILPATKTKVVLQLSGTPGTVIPPGQLVSIPGVAYKLTNLNPITLLVGLTPAEFEVTITGPLPVYAGTATVIDTPVSGWTAVTNAVDAYVIGSNIESDTAYRVRQEQTLRGAGSSTLSGIRSAVFKVLGVTDCFVFENTTDMVDADGLLPHTFEVVVAGGLSLDIANTIQSKKAAGVGTSGNTSVAVLDANGFSNTVKFTRAAARNVNVTINVTVDAGVFPVNGVDLIKSAVVSFGDSTYRVGTEVRGSAMLPAVFSVPGVLEAALPLLALTPTVPTGTNTLSISIRELADLDTSRITVNITATVPQ
jgi:uncharacterized phage protein gp47/JayE